MYNIIQYVAGSGRLFFYQLNFIYKIHTYVEGFEWVYSPLTVSPLTMTQSVPSRTELATPEPLARVMGRGFFTILSSICSEYDQVDFDGEPVEKGIKAYIIILAPHLPVWSGRFSLSRIDLPGLHRSEMITGHPSQTRWPRDPTEPQTRWPGDPLTRFPYLSCKTAFVCQNFWILSNTSIFFST